MKKKFVFKKEYVSQTILHLVIAALLFCVLYPLAFALWNAFKSQTEYTLNKWVPSLPLRVSNIATAFGYVKTYVFNTLKVAVVGTVGMLAISSLASFAISRIRFPGAKFCYGFVLMLMMMPGIITLVPSFLLYKKFGLYDNFFALILPIWTNGSLMSVFLFVTFFNGLPNEMFEAAEMDGGGTLAKYFGVALPLSMPILGTATIIQIVSIWNDYLWQQVVMSDAYTLAAGLLKAFNGIEWDYRVPVVYSGYLIASAPLIILFVAANKYYIRGLVGTSIKM